MKKLGFVQAVKTATKCGMPDYYSIWMTGDLRRNNNPAYAAWKNKHRTVDSDDFYTMLYRVEMGKQA